MAAVVDMVDRSSEPWWCLEPGLCYAMVCMLTASMPRCNWIGACVVMRINIHADVSEGKDALHALAKIVYCMQCACNVLEPHMSTLSVVHTGNDLVLHACLYQTEPVSLFTLIVIGFHAVCMSMITIVFH